MCLSPFAFMFTGLFLCACKQFKMPTVIHSYQVIDKANGMRSVASVCICRHFFFFISMCQEKGASAFCGLMQLNILRMRAVRFCCCCTVNLFENGNF